VDILRSPLYRLNNAFKDFFRRVKARQTPGYPRFRSRVLYTSFSFPAPPLSKGRRKILNGNRITIPRVGAVKFNLYRPVVGDIKVVRVKRTGTAWTLSLVVDLGAAPIRCLPKTSVGIDVGLTTFATLSTGVSIDNQRFARAAEDLLATRQRKVARKKRGSNSRQRAKGLVRHLHEHIRNQRLDFARKEAKKLFEQFDLVAFEDLDIQRMARGNLAKSINDAGWGLFIRCLQSKAENAGKWAVAVNPRGTTIECSRCGERVSKALSEREHRCTSCGLVLGRDHNAAINILTRGLRVLDDCVKAQSECEAQIEHGLHSTVYDAEHQTVLST
jgi:putative transposase